ncbi:MAG TPA: nucleotidyltransferase domain-containing protein [Solirubrobacteraceae bacterium]|jgi:predicted nucleotidyltransferase|nr:nucleotidyltransferase domain-containing protein [Solirubrobacteraceae bacterium]
MFDDALISEAARRLQAAAPESRVLLFGSYARGEAGPDSDLDFLVIEPVVDDPAEESVRLRGALTGLHLFADVVVASEREVDQWGTQHGSFIHTALSEAHPVAVS